MVLAEIKAVDTGCVDRVCVDARDDASIESTVSKAHDLGILVLFESD
jgi:EAL domain-containing protein (putative c-di-GMP-specific phosphodiesterase class I)